MKSSNWKLRDQIDPSLKLLWESEQSSIKSQILLHGLEYSSVHYVAGLDISFNKQDLNKAMTYLVILSFPDL
jgi:deoxyinosine 3'endonuclease (endonuclease V)